MKKRQTFLKFATETLGLTFTMPWQVLLATMVDGLQPSALEGQEREVARELFGSGVDEIDPALRRVQVWRLGRSSGKTTTAVAVGIYCGWTAALRSGKGHVPTVFIVAPSKALAKIGTGVARELVRGTPLDGYVESDVDGGFTLRRPDGRLVAIRSVAASRGGANLRGTDVVAMVLDESEFFAGGEEGDYQVTDRDQVDAVMPRLLEFVLMVSTPWPTENLTGETFDRNWGRPQDAVAAVGPSMLMRPTPQLERDRERELSRDSENASREYDCLGGTRGGTRLFDMESVRNAVVEGRPLVVMARAGTYLSAGADVAFERDSSAIAICGRDGDGVVELLEFDEIKPARGAPLSPRYVVQERFASTMRKHGVRTLWADAHYRQSVVEHLNAVNLGMADAPTGNQGKYDSFLHLRDLLRSGRLRLPDSPRLIGQLRAVTATPLPMKGTKISSPRRAGSGHGDIVSGLVLAAWGLRVVVTQEQVARANEAFFRNIEEQLVVKLNYGTEEERAEIIARDDREYRERLREAQARTTNNPQWQAKQREEWERFLKRGQG